MLKKNYFQEQTLKAMNNFGKGSLNRDFIIAFAEVKKACMISIQEYSKKFEPELFESIIKAIDFIIQGEYDEQFILPFKQGGAGTSINMNFNEVIAGLSEEIYYERTGKKIKVDPIETINLYQSTNDVFPTALTIMLYRHLVEIEAHVIYLQESLIKKENEYANILITGRTELQDALPITMGQVFGSWAGSIERDRWRLNKLKDRIRSIALGGTAIGTCFFAPREYIFIAEKKLREITGLPLTRSQNLPDEISNTDKLSELSSGYSILSQNLFKITGDLLLYTSSFIKEIEHPVLQYGSSIMAAKTNPVILEYVRGQSINIQGECTKIANYTQNGQLQLNSYLPFITECFIEIYESFDRAIKSFCELFLKNITINPEQIENNLVNSYVLLNTLVPVLGYNKIKEIYSIIKKMKLHSIDELKKIILKHSDIKTDELKEYFHPFYAAGFLNE